MRLDGAGRDIYKIKAKKLSVRFILNDRTRHKKNVICIKQT